MWWLKQRSAGRRIARLAVILGVAGCAGGCFQPLYADKSVDGAPSLRTALGTIDVKPITAAKGSDEARLAVEVRNSLLYDFTGGGAGGRSAYALTITMASTVADIIVDTTTTRPAIGTTASTPTSLTEIVSNKRWSPADLRARLLRHSGPGAALRPHARLA